MKTFLCAAIVALFPTLAIAQGTAGGGSDSGSATMLPHENDGKNTMEEPSANKWPHADQRSGPGANRSDNEGSIPNPAAPSKSP